MKLKLTASAALVLLLAAAGTQASPIVPLRPNAPVHSLAERSEGYGLQSLVWGNPGAHRHARVAAQPSLPGNRHSGFGFAAPLAKDPWSGFRFHPALCGKVPGAGVVPQVPGEEQAWVPDAEAGSPDEEESPTLIADTHSESDQAPQGIPAVPEPGSLALLGAGLLGLLAARSRSKAR